VPAYRRFVERFPDAATLASAGLDEVLRAWGDLGYNRRAANLHRAARVIVQRGTFPSTVSGLLELPGVGPYTARAVASLAFGVPAGVVDTNVRRWLLRRFRGPDTPARLQAVADALAAPGRGDDIAAWTHASMEFGAAVCRPRDPHCDACPIARGCPSRNRASAVPVARQASLRGSDRAYRGAVLRLLSSAHAHAMAARDLRASLENDVERIGPVLEDVAWKRVLTSLERDGLVHRSGGSVRLGAATIGP